MSMVPALQFDNWQWLALLLATPVVLWGGWPFHRAAWANLRHGAATMDTLVSLGVARRVAAGRSYALFLGDAGMTGHEDEASTLIPRPRGGRDEIYLEVAAGVDDLHPRRPLLRGARQAPRRRGAAALLELGAKDVAVLGADGAERRVPIEQLAVGDRFVVRPGEKVATDGVVEAGTLRGRPSRCSPASRCRSRSRPGDEVAGATVNAGGRLVVRATQRRRRHRAGADRAARDRGADRQGAGAAARRPRLGRVRAGRDRARGRDARLLAGHRRERRRSRSPPPSRC